MVLENSKCQRHSLLTWQSLTGGRSYFVRRRTDRCSLWSSGDRDLATNNVPLGHLSHGSNITYYVQYGTKNWNDFEDV